MLKIHDFDPPYDLPNWNVCQLIPETADGFPPMEAQVHHKAVKIASTMPFKLSVGTYQV